MHELWGEEYSLHALEKMWREVRKRGGICTGMSQNLIDAQRNRSTKTMVSNSEFMLLLDQGTMDKEAVEDLFDISAEQLACVNGADPGMGLIRFGDKIVPFDNTMKKIVNCISCLIRTFMRLQVLRDSRTKIFKKAGFQKFMSDV